MKKLTASLSLLLTLLAPGLLFAQSISGQVNSIPGVPQAVGITATAGPQLRPDGSAGAAIGDREGNTKVALGHAEYTESARRGKVFTLAANAYTILATNISAGNIGSAVPIVGFYNPIGSGVNAVILGHKEYHTSGTPGGPLLWNFFCGNQNWSTAASGTIFNNLLTNSASNSAMTPVNNAVLGTTPAISSALKVLGVASGPTTGAAALGEDGQSIDAKGSIVVQPGCFLGLMATAAGTTDIVNASISWEEVAP